MSLDATADFSRFDEAIEWYLDRIVLSPDQLGIITRRAIDRSWWVAGVGQANIVQQVFDSLAEAMNRGEAFSSWKKRISPAISRAWSLRGGAAANRLAVIYRNAIQTSYGRGRYAQMTEPGVKQLRPYWMFDAVMDSRTSPICGPLDNTILPADDPWWDDHYPPLHHQCRSAVRTLRESDARRRGIAKEAPQVPAQDGFGQTPRADTRNDRPDTSKLDPALSDELNRKAQESRVA